MQDMKLPASPMSSQLALLPMGVGLMIFSSQRERLLLMLCKYASISDFSSTSPYMWLRDWVWALHTSSVWWLVSGVKKKFEVAEIQQIIGHMLYRTW